MEEENSGGARAPGSTIPSLRPLTQADESILNQLYGKMYPGCRTNPSSSADSLGMIVERNGRISAAAVGGYATIGYVVFGRRSGRGEASGSCARRHRGPRCGERRDSAAGCSRRAYGPGCACVEAPGRARRNLGPSRMVQGERRSLRSYLNLCEQSSWPSPGQELAHTEFSYFKRPRGREGCPMPQDDAVDPTQMSQDNDEEQRRKTWFPDSRRRERFPRSVRALASLLRPRKAARFRDHSRTWCAILATC